MINRWKPIETAPKDGTWLDVWVEEFENGAPAGRWEDVSWNQDAWRGPSVSSVAPYLAGFKIPGRITHWMYPPEAPSGGSQLIAGKTLEEWREFARRDDCLEQMVPSDLRQLIGAITE